MALTQAVAGARIVISDINAYFNLLKGAAGEAITLIYNATGSLVFQPSSDPAADTQVVQIKNNSGTVLSALTYDGKFRAADGTLSRPAYAFDDDDNTGMYISNADQLDLVAGGTAVLRVTPTQVSKVGGRTRHVWIGPQEFIVSTGADLALRGSNSHYQAWAFDATAVEVIIGQFLLPEDYSTGNLTVKLHWTNLGAGSGDVYWEVALDQIADTENLNTNGFTFNTSNAITAPGQNVEKVSTLTLTQAGTASTFYKVFVQRTGSQAADTLANDAGLTGIEIEYNAVI
jgi:hypothetical protein